MSVSKLDRLIGMVNQIALNMGAYGSDDVVAEHVLQHLQKFWSPLMKNMIIEELSAPETELSSAALLAVKKLEQLQKAKKA